MKKQAENKNLKSAIKQFKTVLIASALTIIFLTACQKADLEQKEPPKTAKEEEKDGGYVMSIKSTEYIHEVPWENGFAFDIIFIERMSNRYVEENANREIEKAATSWIKEEYTDAAKVDVEIYDHSSQYLSFGNRFLYATSKQDYILNNYITIDMKSGKRVMLNDLVEINADFIKYIQKNNLAKESQRVEAMLFDSVEENLWEYLQEFTTDELLEALEECSKTPDEIIAENDVGHLGPLMDRWSFYLRSGKIVIVMEDDRGIHITFDLEDISDYLKVEPWS